LFSSKGDICQEGGEIGIYPQIKLPSLIKRGEEGIGNNLRSNNWVSWRKIAKAKGMGIQLLFVRCFLKVYHYNPLHSSSLEEDDVGLQYRSLQETIPDWRSGAAGPPIGSL